MQSQRMVTSAEQSRKLRPLALALVLGLLGIVIFVVAADAYVAKRTKTTLVDFADGTFLFTGLLDIPEEGIDSVQLMPIGLTGDWGTSTQPLPERLANLASAVNRDKIYVVGGTDFEQDVRAEVYASQMSLDGELTPWQTQSPLPEGRAGSGIAVQELDANTAMLYILGGIRPNYFASNAVYRAPINMATGQVGTWQADSQSLPKALYYAPAVTHKDNLYIIGGFGGIANAVPFATVYRAPINGNGSLGAFVETSPLPEPLYNGMAVVYDGETVDTLYLIGGRNNVTSTFKVYFADILSDGGLTPWTLSQGNLPVNLYGHSGVLLSGEIILTGGVANSIDPSTGISNTVKAALVDPGNPSFRLYDWCMGVPPPNCTIGAWQTGALLPEVRALHGSVAGITHIYVIGGEDALQRSQNTVFLGKVTGVGALYSPQGQYRSVEMDLDQPAELRRLDWEVTIGHPGEMGLTMQYRYRLEGEDLWSAWSDPVDSTDGIVNQIEFDPPIEDVRLFQFQANLNTDVSNASPLLDWVELYYDVPDPEVAVRKDTGALISVTVDTQIDYTVYYTNNGGWMAEGTVLTETVPQHASYVGGPEWQQVGTTNIYEYQLGNVPRGAKGTVPFSVKVNSAVPKDTESIVNNVAINYPPMIDAFNQTITDPYLPNNSYEFGNPFLPYLITATKHAETKFSDFVVPGHRITYTMIYTNELGSAPAPNAYILDALPDYTEYVSGSIFGPGADASNPAELRWNLSTVAPGQWGLMGFVVTATQSAVPETEICNTATILSDIGLPKTSAPVCVPVVAGEYDIRAAKYADPPPGSFLEPGDRITYTLHYTNYGFMALSQAVLTDTFDPNHSYTVLTANPPPDEGDNVWKLGNMAPTQNGGIEIVVQLENIMPSNWIVSNGVSADSLESKVWHAPIVTHVVTNPGASLTDFTLQNLTVMPLEPEADEPVDFYVDVSNEGTLNAGEYFWASLYIKPAPSEPPSGPSDHDYGYCMNGCTIIRPYYLHYFPQMDAGQSMQISFTDDQIMFPAPGTYDVYVQMDVAFSDPHYDLRWGVYPEENEYNNMAHIRVIVGGPRRIYLPAIFRPSQ